MSRVCSLYGCETWTTNKQENDTLYWGPRNVMLAKDARDELDRKNNEPSEGNTIVDRYCKYKEMANDRTHVQTRQSNAHGLIIEGTRSRGRPRTRYISRTMMEA